MLHGDFKNAHPGGSGINIGLKSTSDLESAIVKALEIVHDSNTGIKLRLDPRAFGLVKIGVGRHSADVKIGIGAGLGINIEVDMGSGLNSNRIRNLGIALVDALKSVSTLNGILASDFKRSHTSARTLDCDLALAPRPYYR